MPPTACAASIIAGSRSISGPSLARLNKSSQVRLDLFMQGPAQTRAMPARAPALPSDVDLQAMGRRLSEEMARVGRRQVDVAKQCQVTRAAVSNWIGGKNAIDFHNLYTLGRTFNISVDYVLFGRPSPAVLDLATKLSTARPETLRDLSKMFTATVPDARVEEAGYTRRK
jgi:transcriptional regulator with XRE-family HTH domain